MSYLGYQTSAGEIEKVDLLRSDAFGSSLGSSDHRLHFQRAFKLGEAFGYDCYAVYECIIRYEYLKKYTYSGCTFEAKEMFGIEQNNFLNLLETRHKLLRYLEDPSLNSESNNSLVGTERELGLHLLRFTEIIEDCILILKPHLLCEYLHNLCKNVTKVLLETDKPKVWLFEAALVVIDKSLDILGMTREPATQKLQIDKPVVRDHYWLNVPSPNLSSRFEIFSMHVDVFATEMKKGHLFGEINVADTYGLHPDKWGDTDIKGHGLVAYFEHEWHDPVEISCASYKPIPLGNPASSFSLPFSTSVKIHAELWVTCEDKVYELCHVDTEKGKIDLHGFWNGDESIKHSSFQLKSRNAYVRLNYVLIKEGVDTSLRLKYEILPGHNGPNPRLRGWIHAYYGDEALQRCPGSNKDSFKAVVYSSTQATKLVEGNLDLHKSTLAVPKDGLVVFDCFFEDIDTGEITENKHYWVPSKCNPCEGFYEWLICSTNFRLSLTLEWIQQSRL